MKNADVRSVQCTKNLMAMVNICDDCLLVTDDCTEFKLNGLIMYHFCGICYLKNGTSFFKKIERYEEQGTKEQLDY